jgi:hypothetical protein
MKECPNCKKVYTDDLFFCLYDGVSLTEIRNGVDHSAPTEVAYDVGSSLRTEVLPNVGGPAQTQISPQFEMPQQKSHSILLYVAIGALALACVTLAAAMIAMNRDLIFPASNTNTKAGNETKPTPAPSPVASNTTQSTKTIRAVNTATDQPTANLNPAGKWKGEWSTASGTLLDFELTLNETGSNNLEGQIKWTMRKTARPDKMDKIGLSATEFVRGTFDPATGSVNMSGYGKDDPNNVLVMLDVYKLNVSSDGHTLSGSARNGGKWNGHIKLTR